MPVLAPLKRETCLSRDEQAVDEFIAKWKGKLGGVLLMIAEPMRVRPQSEPALHRYSNAELEQLSVAPKPSPPIDFLDP